MKYATYRKSGFGHRIARALRWSFYLLLLLALLDVAYLAWIWPDWQSFQQGPIQRSSFIRDYEAEQRLDPDLPELDWNPVALNRIPQHMVRSVIIAEDSRFYSHGGIDWQALGEAMQYNLARGRLIYGGSTISQQTAKNLFLSPSRNPLRKWHELVLTLAMEHHLSKRRILEHYLNVAQFGHGLFGVDAAARHYWGIPASSLSKRQAIELAASLPSPMTTNPAARNRTFLNRVTKISRHFRRWASD
ncbi:MAG: monofunctional biosynthetic peptidoglycan transglycosylase [Gammaproteobacteria bacterium]|jgi:monofunctional biosynthetic peptidoglycan transglycosylase|nr:monofunctional biosynthetic peptidoglycan transglycosylase [Gammaproteobacteria bacterium]